MDVLEIAKGIGIFVLSHGHYTFQWSTSFVLLYWPGTFLQTTFASRRSLDTDSPAKFTRVLYAGVLWARRLINMSLD
jgi:hypothetical protein